MLCDLSDYALIWFPGKRLLYLFSLHNQHLIHRVDHSNSASELQYFSRIRFNLWNPRTFMELALKIRLTINIVNNWYNLSKSSISAETITKDADQESLYFKHHKKKLAKKKTTVMRNSFVILLPYITTVDFKLNIKDWLIEIHTYGFNSRVVRKLLHLLFRNNHNIIQSPVFINLII